MTVDPVALVLSLAVSTGFLVAVIVLVWWVDRYDREPLPLVGSAFAWGVLGAPFLVIWIGGSSLWNGLAAEPGSAILQPVLEEVLKGVVLVVLVISSRHFDNPTDGLVYGTAVGLGFAVAENALYGIWAGSRMNTEAAVSMILGRSVLSAGIHALSSSCLGVGLGFARISSRKLGGAASVLGGLVMAIGLHTSWNFLPNLFPATAKWSELIGLVAPLYMTFLLVFGLMLAAEHRILLRQLSEEVALGVLPGWTARVIPFYRRRIRSDWWSPRRERIVISRLLTRLAFRKEALSRRGDRGLEGLEVVKLREQIQLILGKPAGAAAEETPARD